MITALYIILAIIVLIVLVALIAPKSYHVERDITINRSISDVFDYVKFVKNANHWSPWKKKDPNMTQEYEGTDGEAGFISKWDGNKEVGTGEQEIKRVVENEIIESELRFFKPWKSKSDAYLKLEKLNESATKIRWGFSGKNPMPFNIFMLFFSFEKAVGKDFEEGLESLKSILEEN